MGLFDKIKSAAEKAKETINDSGVVDKIKSTAEKTKDALNDSGIVDTIKSSVMERAENLTSRNQSAPVYETDVEYEVSTEFEIEKYLDTGDYRISKYIGFDAENIEIPSVIDGKNVVSIGSDAFSHTTVKFIKLGNGFKYIENGAFYESNLLGIILPETLETIEFRAFENSKLQRIIIPDSVTEIGEECFKNCENMTYAKLPQKLECISDKLFWKTKTKIDFPEEVSHIGDHPFEGTYLKLTKLPDTIKTLGPGALYGRIAQQEEFRLPDGLEKIGEAALGGLNCQRLIIPGSVTEINDRAFCYSEIEEVRFEPGCSGRLRQAFDGCKNIKRLYIPKSITEIDMLFEHYIDYSSPIKDQYGRQVYNHNGNAMYNVRITHLDSTNDELVIYCEAGSAAMDYARENNIKCLKWEI